MGDASTQLGRYQLVRKLATGGMAEVFLAKAIGPGGFEKSLVIKRILPNLAQDPEFVEMFLHEARLAAQLNHPNVVQIFDFGEVDGTFYLAMEYVDGPNLRSVLRRAPGRKMPATLGAKLIAQACEGLAYAHEFADPATGEPLNLIHRDVSADNLLVARNGTVKVVDFGVAKVEGQATRDEPGVVKGKIAYMPPEQIVGTPDKRADVYALGVILYELASGQRPYDAETDNELMVAIVQREPVPLRTRAPDVPPGFASVVAKAMARDPDERFASCRDLQVALEDFIASTGERVGSVHLAQFVSTVMGATSASGQYARVGGSVGAADAGPGTSPRGTPVSSPSSSRSATGRVPSPALSPPGTGRTSTAPLDANAATTSASSRPKTGAVPAVAAGTRTSGGFPMVAPVVPPVVPPSAPRLATSTLAAVPASAPPRQKTGLVPSIPPVPASSPRPPTSTLPAVTPSRPPTTRHSPAAPIPPVPLQTQPETEWEQLVDAATQPFHVGPADPAPAPTSKRTDWEDRAVSPGASSKPRGVASAAGRDDPLPAPPRAALPAARPPSGDWPPPPPVAARPGSPFGLSPEDLKTVPATSVAALQSDVSVVPPSVDEWELDVPTGVGTAPNLPAAGPALTPGSAEARAAEVLARAEALRNYEPGPPLVADDALRKELERDETVNLFVRFATHAARLMAVHPHAPAMLAERLAGAVEGLFAAEAWGPLARLLERLEVLAPTDTNSTWVWSTVQAAFVTPEMAQRVLERLREVAPVDLDGFGRCVRFFGAAYVPLFLEALEPLELAGSREALLHGLAELSRVHPEPFVARVVEERPRRLADFVWLLEKGRAPDRQRAFRQVLARRDAGLRREVLSGLARARTEEAYNLLTQALGDREEAVRVHALELLAKHYPERVLRHAESLLAPDGYEAKSAVERQAIWRAVGSASQPEALGRIADAVTQKASLLNRARVQQLKVDALEGLALVRAPAGGELLRAVAADASQPGPVVDAARRLLASPYVEPRAVQLERRWDRVSSTPRAFLRELSALVQAARLVDAKAEVLDMPFRRLRVQLDALVAREGRAVFAVDGRNVTLNGLAPSDAQDAAMLHLAAMCGRYQVGGFSLTASVSDGELRELVRWMAEGPCAAGVQTPNVQRQVLGAAPPARASTPAPQLGDPSREAMTRFVDLIFSLDAFLAAQKQDPKARPGDARRTLDELACAMQTRAVRFVGLSPRSVGRESVAFHHANVAVLSLAFAAELGVPLPRLEQLAEVAFFHDVGMYELPEETLTRAGELTAADKDAMQAARRVSAWFPFERLGAEHRALAWATAIVEHGLDWGARDAAGVVLQRNEIGVVGGILSLAKMYDALTSRRSFRPAMSPEAALEMMVTKAAHRFRPDLLALFVSFIKRHRLRPLGA